MVSHTSFKTPTKAAQFFVEKVKTFVDTIDTLGKNIFLRSGELIKDRKRSLHQIGLTLGLVLPRYFRDHNEELLDKKYQILNRIKLYLTQQKQQNVRFSEKINSAISVFLKNTHHSIKNLENKLTLLDPRAVLRRGYSVTLKEGRPLKSIEAVDKGDQITTVLYQGRLKSQVQKKEPGYGQKDHQI